MKVFLNQKGTQRVLLGHPWIFRSDLNSDTPASAGPVAVYSSQKKLLGEALYSPKSLIALRMMTRGEERITSELIRKRISNAFELRERLFPHSPVYRGVFGESDGLPSLIIDRFRDVLVFQTLSAGMDFFKSSIIEFLAEHFSPQVIVEKNDAVIRKKEDLPLQKQVVYGEGPEEVEIEYEGLTFQIRPLDGQKTGFFLDQRLNALKSAPYAQGKTLDVFSYTGQFGLRAAPYAESVLCVDISESATQWVHKQALLNKVKNLEAKTANAFDFLKEMDKGGEKYDTIFLDPPAFVKGRKAIEGAIRGYKEINLRAMRLLNPGGILVSSSCSQNLSSQQFEKVISQAARDSHRQPQVLEVLGQAPDHPWLPNMPESRYLKCYVMRIL